MKVLCDHQIFEQQSFGGISRYFCALIDYFERQDDVDITLTSRFSNNEHLRALNSLNTQIAPLSSYDSFLKGFDFRGKRRVYRLLRKAHLIRNGRQANKLASMRCIKQRDFDVFHPTYYSTYFLDYIGSKPFVLTVYDMIHELYSDTYPELKEALSEKKKVLMERSAKIIAISNSTKNDIIKLYGIDADKIHVTHLASSLQPDQNARHDAVQIPSKYVLFVGLRKIYKNFRGMLDALTPLLQEDASLHVVCAGGGGFTPDELAYLEELNIRNQVLFHPINDSTLVQLYEKALAFVFPSLYEGFGIPILEAFACKCPVLLSLSSSFPEVASDAALYFDPTEVESIRETVSSVLQNEGLREDLRERGLSRLSHFSWDKTATETLEVYRSLT